MAANSKLEKLTASIKILLDTLSSHPKSLHIHSKVSEFYYMQKLEELRLLQESIKESVNRLKVLEDKFELTSKQVYNQLRKDVKSVNTAIISQKNEVEIKS